MIFIIYALIKTHSYNTTTIAVVNTLSLSGQLTANHHIKIRAKFYGPNDISLNTNYLTNSFPSNKFSPDYIIHVKTLSIDIFYLFNDCHFYTILATFFPFVILTVKYLQTQKQSSLRLAVCGVEKVK